MSKTNKTADNEFASSFCNAFDIIKDGDSSSLSNSSLNTIGMSNEDFVSDYLNHAYMRSKPPMLKSLSWSSTEPSIACERDSYLMPYAYQYNNTKPNASYRRHRSMTLPPKASPRYLCVDRQNHSKTNSSSFRNNHRRLSSHSSLSTLISANLTSIKEATHHQLSWSSSKRKANDESGESAYSSQKELDRFHFDLYDKEGGKRADIDDISRLYMQPRRARAYTAPPGISITFENGYSKTIF